MKKFQRMLGMCLVVLATAGLIVACGGDGAQDECLDDADCGTGELCNFETSTCTADCTDDATVCGGDEECVPRESGDDSICVPAAGDNNGGTNNGTECTTAEDCPVEGHVCEAGVCAPPCQAGDCQEGFTCNEESGICEEDGGATLRYAKIRDASTGDEACADTTNPGSDIFGVELQTADGTFYAEVANADGIDTTDNEFTKADTVLDGNPPGMDADACSSDGLSNFDDQNILALGCLGEVIVKFADSEGTPVFIADGDSITVFEYGATCEGGSAADDWRVEVCQETGSEAVELDGTCDGITQGADVSSGIDSVTVEIPE